MRYLRQNTAVRISVGPFLDKTDGITPEVALTATNEKITMIKDDDDNTACNLIIDANATASGGDNDLVHISGDDAGYYDLELTAAQTNYIGRVLLSINYVTDHCPVFHEFTILPAQVYDSLILGTDLLDANASQLGGTSQTGRDVGASVLVGDKTGFSLSTAGISAIWDQLLTAITTVGSIGKLIKDYLDAAISTRSTYAGGAVASVTAGVTLADDAISAGKFDESTAFPLKAADAGSTAVARAGADSDTLETLSDQIDAEAIKTAAIKAKTDMHPTVWYSA